MLTISSLLNVNFLQGFLQFLSVDKRFFLYGLLLLQTLVESSYICQYVAVILKNLWLGILLATELCWLYLGSLVGIL
jgi:hypothetical protein